MTVIMAKKYPNNVNKQKLSNQNLSRELSLFLKHDLLISWIMVFMFMRLQIVKPSNNHMA